MANHTSGPWNIEGSHVVGGGGLIVRQAAAYDAAQDDLRLIAAAPELLEALIDVMGWIPNGGAWHTEEPMKAMERARAVIAKATSP